MQPSAVSNDDVWDKFLEALNVNNAEELLPSFKRVVLENVLTKQLHKTRGDTALAVKITVGLLRTMEAAIEQTHVHERLMDKEYFGELVNSDMFLLRGIKSSTGTPVAWVRDGYASKGIWRLKEGSPRAHAHIRYQLYILQYFTARVLAEGTCGNPCKPVLTIVYDLSEVNLFVTKQVTSLIIDLLHSLSVEIYIVGLSRVSSVSLNLAFELVPSTTTREWKVLEDRDKIEEIVTSVKDIPHWYYDEGDARKERGARRCESDVREYGCWRRCLSEDEKISLKDTFNPDAATWLDCFEVEGEVECAAKNNGEEFGKLDAIGEDDHGEDGEGGEDGEDGEDGW